MLPLRLFSNDNSSRILTIDQRANIAKREKLRTHPKIFSVETSNDRRNLIRYRFILMLIFNFPLEFHFSLFTANCAFLFLLRLGSKAILKGHELWILTNYACLEVLQIH